jgi:hypothetical protein
MLNRIVGSVGPASLADALHVVPLFAFTTTLPVRPPSASNLAEGG